MVTLTLTDIIQETTDVKSFRFQAEPQFDWTAGQYLQITLPHDNPDNRGQKRYFTISAAPTEGFVQITTRFANPSSSFKSQLQNLAKGAQLQAVGPSGDFTYPNPEQEVVFIAGGIGITPYRSILVDLDAKNLNPKINLLYANRDQNDIPFKQLFDSLAAKHSNLKINYLTGHLDEQAIRQHVPDLQTPVFYVSGPEPMVEALGKTLQEMGVPRNRIEQDFFPGYEA